MPRGSDRKGRHRQRWVRRRRCGQNARVTDVQVFKIMGAALGVHHRGHRVRPHARRAALMAGRAFFKGLRQDDGPTHFL